VPDFEPGPYHQGPLYRFPGIVAASFTIAPVALAVARGAITEVMALAERKTAFGFQRPLRERPAVQAALARAEGVLRAARLFYYDQTLRHHGFLSENRFEAVGQVYCGVPPEFPMITF
jgi:alkylation response protein AidB-like acyl-CoA dehydrogenase